MSMSAGADASSAGGEPFFVVAEEPCTFARFSIEVCNFGFSYHAWKSHESQRVPTFVMYFWLPRQEFHRHFGNVLREVAERQQTAQLPSPQSSSFQRARFRSEISYGTRSAC